MQTRLTQSATMKTAHRKCLYTSAVLGARTKSANTTTAASRKTAAKMVNESCLPVIRIKLRELGRVPLDDEVAEKQVCHGADAEEDSKWQHHLQVSFSALHHDRDAA